MYTVISDPTKGPNLAMKQFIFTDTIEVKDVNNDCVRVILAQEEPTTRIVDVILEPNEAIILAENLTRVIRKIILHEKKEKETIKQKEKDISEKILFGDENPHKVNEEILTGTRPTNWNVPGHSDHTIWVKTLALR